MGGDGGLGKEVAWQNPDTQRGRYTGMSLLRAQQIEARKTGTRWEQDGDR